MTMTSFALRFLGTMALVTCAWTAPTRAQSCATNADCTAPLTCKPGPQNCSGGGGILPDGGTFVLPTTCENEAAACTWVFVACQADSECTLPNWACLSIPGQTVVKTCLPKYMTCSAAQACPTAWSCLDSNTTYHNDPVDLWGVARGTSYCWPDSLSGVLTGSTRTDSSGLDLTSGGTDGQGRGIGDAAVPISLGDGESGTAGTNGSPTTTPAPASSGSGCTIAGQSATAAPFVLLALFGLLRLGRARKK